MSEKQTEIIILRESAAESWLSDIGTALAIVAVIGTGWWLGSEAMQWAGFLMLVVGVLAFRSGRRDRLTPQEAADRLARVYGARASEDSR